jgi:hypothetical protein
VGGPRERGARELQRRRQRPGWLQAPAVVRGPHLELQRVSHVVKHGEEALGDKARHALRRQLPLAHHGQVVVGGKQRVLQDNREVRRHTLAGWTTDKLRLVGERQLEWQRMHLP